MPSGLVGTCGCAVSYGMREDIPMLTRRCRNAIVYRFGGSCPVYGFKWVGMCSRCCRNVTARRQPCGCVVDVEAGSAFSFSGKRGIR